MRLPKVRFAAAALVGALMVAGAPHATANPYETPTDRGSGSGAVDPGAAEQLGSGWGYTGFVHVTEVFEAAYSGGDGVTYDPALVPLGATVTVASRSLPHATVTLLTVHGVVPGRDYGAHVHVNPCGADPDAAGPHYQHAPDPIQPSVDPEYANPANEIWLDLSTDNRGSGAARSDVRWFFTDRLPGAVVLHEHRTSVEPGMAGTAGARIACVNVPFRALEL